MAGELFHPALARPAGGGQGSIATVNPTAPFFLFWLLLPTAGAIVIRNEAADPARYRRFDGFPAAPAENPLFLEDASRFTGVGWFVQDTRRACALVSPRHFVTCTHWLPVAGNVIGFVGSDGAVVQRTVASVAAIASDAGGDSDLCLATLSAAVPATVRPFPYLNLEDGPGYAGREILAFGMTNQAGRGTIASTLDTTLPGQGPTRMMLFYYEKAGSAADDACFELGDSGSPSFTLESGGPALVGSHSSVVDAGPEIANYDTFVPHYVPKLDALLSPAGYRMRPANFAAAALALDSSAPPGPARQAHAGSWTFTLVNAGSGMTGNVDLRLAFPAGEEPDSVSATGAVVEALGPGEWSVRRATLEASAGLAVTASWSAFPAVAAISPTVSAEADTAAAVAGSPTLPLLPSFAAWAAGLSAAGESDDPDADGLTNLMEYALGGDPASGGRSLEGAHPLLPVLAVEGSVVSVTYPERSDAALRGISYFVETATDPAALAPDSLPAGAVSTAAPYDPDVPGFVKRTITWPADGPRRFVRVRVELQE